MDDADFALDSLTENLGNEQVDESTIFQMDMPNQRPIGMANFKSSLKPVKSKPKKQPRERWHEAILKIKLLKDPWAKFEIHKYPVESVIRHRYDPVKKVWKKDNCQVKMETKPFANGAMRACFRL